MDLVQDFALGAYNAYASIDPYLRPLRRAAYDFRARSYPVLVPLLNKAAVMAQDSPAIVTVGVLLLFLIIAFKILSLARRIVAFWVGLMMRAMFWGGVAMIVAAVAQRGLGKTAEDLVVWGREVSEVWWREYRRWEGYQNQGRVVGAKAGWR